MKINALLILTLLLLAIAPTTTYAQTDETTLWFSEDGHFMVELPAGWSADVQSQAGMQQLQIANRENMASTSGPAFESGDRALSVLAIPQADFVKSNLSPEEAFADFAESFMTVFMEAAGGEVTSELVIEGNLAELEGSIPQFDLYIRGVETFAPDYFGMFTLLTPTGELTTDAREELLAVADTIQYSPPLDEQYQADDAALTFSFDHPTEWEVFQENFERLPLVGIQRELTYSATNDEEPLPWVLMLGAFPPIAMAELDFSSSEAIEAGVLNIVTGIANSFGDDLTFDEPVFLEFPLAEDLTIAHLVFSGKLSEGGVLLFYDGEQAWVTVYASNLDKGHRLLLLALNAGLTLEYIPE